MTKKTCIEPGCERTKHYPYHRCSWHWLLHQPIEEQVRFAGNRRKRAERRPSYTYRARVPKAEWPEGRRWCSGCQEFVPEFYCRGSRCRAHASQAAHASHVERTYEIDRKTYQALLEWQGGCCYICGQRPVSRRLAVDHDHRTGEVRGLLCAGDDYGCNHTLARPLNDIEVARALLRYVEKSPLERMRAGEPAVPRGRNQRSSPAGTAGGSSITPPRARITSV